MANLADLPILHSCDLPDIAAPYMPTKAAVRDHAIGIKDFLQLRVKFDGADKIPSQVRNNIPHRMFAIETKGDGACGMHAVFGHPDANSELFLPDARAKAVIAFGPYHSVESASNS